jgi:hypothetical protein
LEDFLAVEKRVLRHELKYFIHEADYLWLRDRVATAMPLDTNADPATRGYNIRSLYFDDLLDSALFEKVDGDATRNKFRIRIYKMSDKVIMLEKKSKVMYYTAKDSLQITRQQCDGILAGDFNAIYPSESPLLQEFYGLTKTKLLKPKVIVDYFREAYVYPAGNVRITFDLNIRSGLYSEDLFSGRPASLMVLEPRTHVMEVKYDTFLPPHLKALLQGVPGQRIAVSKYVLCRRFH